MIAKFNSETLHRDGSCKLSNFVQTTIAMNYYCVGKDNLFHLLL